MRRHATVIVALMLAGCTGAQMPKSGDSSSSVPSPMHADIRVTQPTAGALITSPLTVRGEARGTWYFEASFPVRLLDAQGKSIAVTPAQAQGDWMTTDFVPFEALLTFTIASRTGTLVLEKDNPSGLPQYDASITIPVRFGR